MTDFPIDEAREAADKYARENTVFDDEYSCDVRAFTAGYRAAWTKAQGEIEQAKFVPGNFRCAKCDFYLVSSTLFVKSGSVGANNAPQECANGCGPMWRVTQTERLNQVIDKADEARLKLAIAIEALEKAQGEIERLNRIITKELTENDELGSEFTYVNNLRDSLKIAAEALSIVLIDAIRCPDAKQYAMSEWGIQAVQEALAKMRGEHDK